MKLFAGKTPTERNKIIVALVLGVMALFALYMAFGRSLFSRKTTVTASASPTPRPSATTPNANREDRQMPSTDELNSVYGSIPVNYRIENFYAPDAGRNIFAFYEPPPPTPFSPTPPPTPKPYIEPTPVPTPVPPLLVSFVTPQSVYAGAKAFRLEVNGDKFTPESRIFFNESQLPTTFVSPQKLIADIPANFIAGEGARQIIVRTPDGKLYSNQMLLNVQAPPKPQLQYIGMIARKRYNNDTAYFQEQGKNVPIGARLNDVVAGRFRIVSISAGETVLEDVNLGFRHKLALYRPAPGQSTATRGSGQPTDGGFPTDGTYIPYNQGVPNYNPPPPPQQQQEIPGIPNNIPRYVPPSPQPSQPPRKDPANEDEDGEDGND